MKMDRFNPTDIRGVIPPIVTPLLENEDIDEESLRKIVDRCVESGLDGIFVAGSGGETMSLTQEQRNRAIKITLDEADGRIPVLAGVMDTSTRRVIENMKVLEQYGGKTAVVTPPFYIRNTNQDEIIRHYEEIAKNTDLEIIIYNIPANTQVNILPETVEKLSKIDNITGLKESSGNWLQFQKCLFIFKNTHFRVLQGITEMAAVSILLGADGYIPIFGIIYPEIFKKLYKEAKSGSIKGAMETQNIINSLNSLVKYPFYNAEISGCVGEAGNCKLSYTPPLMAVVKYAGSLMGMCGKKVTMPCHELTGQEEAWIKEIFDYYKSCLFRAG